MRRYHYGAEKAIQLVGRDNISEKGLLFKPQGISTSPWENWQRTWPDTS